MTTNISSGRFSTPASEVSSLKYYWNRSLWLRNKKKNLRRIWRKSRRKRLNNSRPRGRKWCRKKRWKKRWSGRTNRKCLTNLTRKYRTSMPNNQETTVSTANNKNSSLWVWLHILDWQISLRRICWNTMFFTTFSAVVGTGYILHATPRPMIRKCENTAFCAGKPPTYSCPSWLTVTKSKGKRRRSPLNNFSAICWLLLSTTTKLIMEK